MLKFAKILVFPKTTLKLKIVWTPLVLSINLCQKNINFPETDIRKIQTIKFGNLNLKL
jgi:hypothetical protein